MQSNVAISLIIILSIAFVILAWIFFSRRRGEFKQALLVTHDISQHQTPEQLQPRHLSRDTPSSDPTQSSSTSSGDAVFEFRKVKKGRVHTRPDRMGKAYEMTGGLGRIDEPAIAERDSAKAEGSSSKDHRGHEGSGQSVPVPVDPVEAGWGSTNTTQEGQDQGGWAGEDTNPGADSVW